MHTPSRSMIHLIAVCLFSLLLAACKSWVQLTPEGSNVELVGDASRVANCARVGRANVQTLGKIIVVERGGQRLQDELLTLARNEAADLDGDTVVPESLISNGEQVFGVYRCRR
jgi:hypothetical protein